MQVLFPTFRISVSNVRLLLVNLFMYCFVVVLFLFSSKTNVNYLKKAGGHKLNQILLY